MWILSAVLLGGLTAAGIQMSTSDSGSKDLDFNKEAILEMINENEVLQAEKKMLFEQKSELLRNKNKPDSVRAIYLTAYSTAIDKTRNEYVDTLLESGGNAVVIDVESGGGKLAFLPKNPALSINNPGSAVYTDLKATVQSLKDRGLYVIARQVIFNDPYVGARKLDWRIRYKGGGLFDGRWIDPSHPEVQNYNLMLMEEVADAGVDEIQLDYIRFPDAYHGNLNYHYDENEHTRTQVLSEFLRKARKVSEEKGVFLSADVFGVTVWGNVDWALLGQHIPTMSQHLDAIYPMTYPSHFGDGFNGYYGLHNAPYKIIHDSIKKFVEQSSEYDVDIRTWVQGFPLKVNNFGSWYMQEQVQATYDAGGTGFAVWSPGNRYGYTWPAMGMEPRKEE